MRYAERYISWGSARRESSFQGTKYRTSHSQMLWAPYGRKALGLSDVMPTCITWHTVNIANTSWPRKHLLWKTSGAICLCLPEISLVILTMQPMTHFFFLFRVNKRDEQIELLHSSELHHDLFTPFTWSMLRQHDCGGFADSGTNLPKK